MLAKIKQHLLLCETLPSPWAGLGPEILKGKSEESQIVYFLPFDWWKFGNVLLVFNSSINCFIFYFRLLCSFWTWNQTTNSTLSMDSTQHMFSVNPTCTKLLLVVEALPAYGSLFLNPLPPGMKWSVHQAYTPACRSCLCQQAGLWPGKRKM